MGRDVQEAETKENANFEFLPPLHLHAPEDGNGQHDVDDVEAERHIAACDPEPTHVEAVALDPGREVPQRRQRSTERARRTNDGNPVRCRTYHLDPTYSDHPEMREERRVEM